MEHASKHSTSHQPWGTVSRAPATKLGQPSLQILLTHLSQAMQIPSALSATTYLVLCPVLRGLNAQVAFLGSTPASSVPASHGLSFSSVHALFSDTRDQYQCLYYHTPSSPSPYSPCLDFPLQETALLRVTTTCMPLSTLSHMASKVWGFPVSHLPPMSCVALGKGLALGFIIHN